MPITQTSILELASAIRDDNRRMLIEVKADLRQAQADSEARLTNAMNALESRLDTAVTRMEGAVKGVSDAAYANRERITLNSDKHARADARFRDLADSVAKLGESVPGKAPDCRAHTERIGALESENARSAGAAEAAGTGQRQRASWASIAIALLALLVTLGVGAGSLHYQAKAVEAAQAAAKSAALGTQ